VRGGSGGWRLQALACCPQHRLPCSRRTHTRRVASSGKLWQHCDACFGPCWALHTSSIFVRSCLLWEAATWELSLGLAQHLPMLSFDSPSPPQRSRPAAAARSAPICWSASPMAPQPHLPPSPAVAASSVAGRLPAGNLLPVEVVQVILRALWYLCPAAPMAAAVSRTFRSAAALTEHSLRACSFVKPRRFAVSVDSLPATMQLHSALTVAERLKLDRAVAPMGARTLWHNALYYNRTLTHDALLAVLGWRLPSTSTRTRGFLGDEEVNDLIGLSIPAVRRGMGAGESLYLPSTIFQNVDASGSCCDLAVSMLQCNPLVGFLPPYSPAPHSCGRLTQHDTHSGRTSHARMAECGPSPSHGGLPAYFHLGDLAHGRPTAGRRGSMWHLHLARRSPSQPEGSIGLHICPYPILSRGRSSLAAPNSQAAAHSFT
jgi:hypothetical protein